VWQFVLWDRLTLAGDRRTSDGVKRSRAIVALLITLTVFPASWNLLMKVFTPASLLKASGYVSFVKLKIYELSK
jgi:hypothetical protein